MKTERYTRRHAEEPQQGRAAIVAAQEALADLEAQARKAAARGRRFNARKADKAARHLAALARF